MTAEPGMGSGAADPSRPPPVLFSAALLSRTANEMTPVAIVLLVLGRGGGLALAGITVGAIALPGIVFGPLLGAWLDRARRALRVIGAEQAVSAVGLCSLAILVGHVPAAVTVCLALVTGAMQPLSTGGMTSLLTGLADDEHLPRATSIEAASFGAASVAGPLLAAVLAGLGGGVVAVLGQASLKLVAIGLTLVAPQASGATVRGDPDREPIAVTVAAGFRHFASAGPLAAVTATGSLAMAGRGLFTVAFPLFAVEALGREQDFAGYLWAAFAAGSAIGAVALTTPTATWARHRVAIGGAALAGLAILPLAIVDSTVVALVSLAIAGALYGPSLAATFDVRRRWTPPDLLGQVFTTAASVKTGSFAFGAAFSGSLVAAVGAGDAILVVAGLHVGAALVGAVLLGLRYR